jgi:cytochrome bd ubiquinol oxidase subunit I
LTGMALWFVSIPVSPRAIGRMVDKFHWIWATEWTFFCVEVVSGYCYLRYKDRMSGKDRMTLLTFYSVASWFSLFWMNGLASSQGMTAPGAPSHKFWSGFLSASFWPTLLCRMIAALAIAALGACVVIGFSGQADRDARRDLMAHCLRFLAPMVLAPFLGIWLWASSPADNLLRSATASPIMTTAIGIAAVASLLVGACGLRAFWLGEREIGGLLMAVLCVSAFAASAGTELMCRSIYKPSSLRKTLHSGSRTKNHEVTERR